MDKPVDSLTVFRWLRPDPSNVPHWVEDELMELQNEDAQFPSQCREKRWMWWSHGPLEGESYSPMDEAPQLWRAFVDLPERDDAYLAFAALYGPLCHGAVL